MKSLLQAFLLFSVSVSALALPPSASHIVSTVRCTLVDTRNAPGPYGGPRMQAGVTRSFAVPAGPCSGLPLALGYNLIFTAIGPDANSVHLKAWATGSPVPSAPTLVLNKGTAPNASDTLSRAAAIDSLTGSVDVQVDVGTHLVIEVNTYYVAGLVFNLNPGVGMTGGGTGNVTLGINTAGASAGQVLTYFPPGGTGWTTPPQGTITGVAAGTGLTGGGSSGNVTLNVDFAGTGAANTAARSDHKHYVQTVFVSPAATPADSGTALITALSGITDNSATKPYLLKIEPGIYDLGTQYVAMKQFVDIEGSGEDVTTITSATNDFDHGTINAASNSELRLLTVISTPGATYSNALTMNGVTNFRARNVTINASGDIANAAIVNSGGSPMLQDVTITSTHDGISIVVFNSKLTVDHASITASSSSGGTGIFNAGVLNVSNSTITAGGTGGISPATGISTGSIADTTVRNCVIIVTADFIAEGIRIYNTVKVDDSEISATTGGFSGATSSAVHLSNNMSGTIANSRLSATATGGSNNTFGVEVDSALNTLWIENCRISAAYRSVSAFSGTVRVAGSRLEGSAFAASCTAVWDGAGGFYQNVCP